MQRSQGAGRRTRFADSNSPASVRTLARSSSQQAAGHKAVLPFDPNRSRFGAPQAATFAAGGDDRSRRRSSTGCHGPWLARFGVSSKLASGKSGSVDRAVDLLRLGRVASVRRPRRPTAPSVTEQSRRPSSPRCSYRTKPATPGLVAASCRERATRRNRGALRRPAEACSAHANARPWTLVALSADAVPSLTCRRRSAGGDHEAEARRSGTARLHAVVSGAAATEGAVWIQMSAIFGRPMTQVGPHAIATSLATRGRRRLTRPGHRTTIAAPRGSRAGAELGHPDKPLLGLQTRPFRRRATPRVTPARTFRPAVLARPQTAPGRVRRVGLACRRRRT